MIQLNQAQKTGYLLLGALILCFQAFYNGYPIVFSDTGAYIHAGFEKKLLIDRSYFYSFFIRHVSMKEWLWFVVFAQSLILAYVVCLCFRYFSTNKSYAVIFTAFLVFVTLFTGVSVITSRLLPDVFTPVCGISLMLLLLVKQLSLRHKITLAIIFIFSVGTHNSHVLIVVGVLASLAFLFLFKKLRLKESISYIRLLSVTGLTIFTFLFIATVHSTLNGGRFSVQSGGGHVFYLARLIEMGVVHPYLEETCKEKNYEICQYKDSIPWDFIWDFNSPLYKTGGWEKNEKEYKAIIRGVLTTPKYLKVVLVKSIGSGIRQFFTFNTVAIRYGDNDSPFINITSYYKYQKRENWSSRQMQGPLDYGFINITQTILFFMCFAGGCMMLLMKQVRHERKMIILFLLIFLLVNAMVCAVFSGVDHRYQNRVVWLVLLPAFLFIAENVTVKSWTEKFQ